MSRKKFEVPDPELWDEVKSAIHPLKLRKPAKTKVKIGNVVVPKYAPTPELIVNARKLRDTPPSIANFDRRTAQKLGRGQADLEARIDLHGENLETARMQLLHFVATQRHRGVRLVLVITGKGASPYARHTLHGHTHFHTPEREGKLRREVPLWFHEAVFRVHVVGFQPAHPKHGGGGAFYVKLRKYDGSLS